MQTIAPRTAPRGTLLLMIASPLWGTAGIASQGLATLTNMNPLSISAFRLLIAAPILLLVGWRLLGRDLWSGSRRDIGLMALIGVLMAADQALYFIAISFVGVTISTLIAICGAPLLVVLFTALIERKAPTRFMVGIVFAALLGTALLVTGSSASGRSSSPLIGIACAAGSACGYAGVLLFGKYLSGKYHSLQITALGFSTGAVCLLIVSHIVGFVGTCSVTGWLIILYMGIFPTALAYGLFLFGMRTTPAPLASVLVLLEPLTASVLSWGLFGERLSVSGIVGAILLVGTIYVLSVSSSDSGERLAAVE